MDKYNNIHFWFKCFNINNDDKYTCKEYYDCIIIKNDIIKFKIECSEWSDKVKSWLLRVAPISDFDEWDNSTAFEAGFDNDIELCKYLYENMLDIHQTIIRYLSKKYDELEQNMYELSDYAE